jgi:hypothetical protein
LVGDSDPDKVEWRPFLGVEGAGEGLAGGSTSLTAKIRLPLRETLGTCSTSLTFDAFLTFILAGEGRIAGEGRKKNQQERMCAHAGSKKRAGGEKKLPDMNHT